MIIQDEALMELIDARSRKEQLQCRSLNRPANGWMDVAPAAWNFEDLEYRIKPMPPKPREWQISPMSPPNEIANTNPPVQYGVITGPRLDNRFMTVREVLPE